MIKHFIFIVLCSLSAHSCISGANATETSDHAYKLELCKTYVHAVDVGDDVIESKTSMVLESYFDEDEAEITAEEICNDVGIEAE